ncbi:MAG TPA: DNA polymerase III subunit alpha, partial [Chitinophagaceae bacterium]|nr:DNA polymerase III subunit alpha [Chitinophagaceae bacterium]
TPEIEERVQFELDTIARMGFAGYFLIVADFIRAGREMGVVIGPGRGSAAGSVVAYCTGITNIDPIKYNLLFERFLNPDRKSMPDIDTDFDDEGRQKVIDYVVEKYGRNQVAQIVTYGTMAARSSIKDVGRVLSLTPSETATLSKLVPERPGIELDRLLHAPLTGPRDSIEEIERLRGQDLENMMKLRQIAKGNDVQARTLREAALLEGSVRNTGIHAAGIIIAPTDLTDLMPVCASRESTLMITQFEGGIIENAGVIKMDFLGLKTLSIIRSAVQLAEKNHGIEIDIDRIPLDDRLTYNLFQQGETLAIFQFESPGMQKYLRELRPDKLDDLIAMNALFRPGPMDYIPQFIRRKLGLESVVYDLPEMEEILKETYGVTVYQEQVMLLSQRLAGFSKGDADVLRKAMGKKQKEVLDKMKSQFMQGCSKNGFSPRTCDKIWGDWESFAQYAFNKSHSTCYALVAYQTAYLKAHYPAEFMAAVLNYASNIEKVTFYMEECRRMGLKVLGPDVNESQQGFAVNALGEIRFGLGGLKGVGTVAVENLLEERQRGGPFRSAFELVRRVNQRTVNKKSLESLVLSGAFDGFSELHRAQYFHHGDGDKVTGLEKIIRFGNQFQTGGVRPSGSLFGDGEAPQVREPQLDRCPPWPLVERLTREKEVTGIFLSGHPLDHFRFELEHYHIQTILQFNELSKLIAENPAAAATNGTQFRLAGFVTSADHKTSQKGNKYGKLQIEDFSGSTELVLIGDDYVKQGAFCQKGYCLFITGGFRSRPYREDEYEFKISSIQLLEDLKKKQTRQIILSGEPSRISSKLVDFLSLHERNHPGKTELRFDLTDPEGQVTVSLRGTQKPVEVNDGLADFLTAQPGLGVQVVVADPRLSKMQ